MLSRLHASDRLLFGVVGLVLLFLIVAPVFLSAAQYELAFSEGGFFETASFWGWILSAGVILFRIRPIGGRAIAFMILVLAFAAREADWQKKFTSDGVLKINYYENAAIPLVERMLAGVVVLILIVGLVYAVWTSIRFLFFSKGWQTRTGFWLFLTGFSLVFGKILDGLPRELDNLFSIQLGEAAVLHLGALEEGIEAMSPFFFIVSVWLSGSGSSYLKRSSQQSENSVA
ncbi:MAG: hypothetical protein AAGJ81_14435 [Verrucomicrobiota bacterium]